jgi:hypothetical protein
MAIATKELLLAKRVETETGFPEETVDVPGLGCEVRVRGLSRLETLQIGRATQDAAKSERMALAMGLVEPAMTEAEVGGWQKLCTSKELEPVYLAIGRLSGMLPESPKEAYREFEVDPGSEFRVLPGSEAVDVGGAPSGGYE